MIERDKLAALQAENTRLIALLDGHGIEVALILQPDIIAESRCPFAIKHHQFGQTFRLADGFFVIGDRLFGFGDRGILTLEHIGP